MSRATLSRLENAEISPTASVLGKLCAAYGLPMSRLMMMVEADFPPLVTADEQPVWRDPAIDFPVHNLFLLGIGNTMWVFRLVGIWWLADGAWRPFERTGLRRLFYGG